MPMRIRLVCILTAFACSQGVFAQAPEPDPKNKFSRAGLPNAKTPLTSATIRRPVTLNQVERDTGGKVIGAKQVNVQGRQLNQIKVLMPNGRIIIHQRLFDEKGRSVETVHADEAGSDPKAKLTDR
ncbi:MAG: hypothetical protein KAY90_04485 [Arenimonas sp.]|nr:hypothetical protein [Arenimonas sp.]